jgi:hypothetical protein
MSINSLPFIDGGQYYQERQKAEGLFLCLIAACVLATEREQGFEAPAALSGSRSGGVESPSERNIKALCLPSSAFFKFSNLQHESIDCSRRFWRWVMT